MFGCCLLEGVDWKGCRARREQLGVFLPVFSTDNSSVYRKFSNNPLLPFSKLPCTHPLDEARRVLVFLKQLFITRLLQQFGILMELIFCPNSLTVHLACSPKWVKCLYLCKLKLFREIKWWEWLKSDGRSLPFGMSEVLWLMSLLGQL